MLPLLSLMDVGRLKMTFFSVSSCLPGYSNLEVLIGLVFLLLLSFEHQISGMSSTDMYVRVKRKVNIRLIFFLHCFLSIYDVWHSDVLHALTIGEHAHYQGCCALAKFQIFPSRHYIHAAVHAS